MNAQVQRLSYSIYLIFFLNQKLNLMKESILGRFSPSVLRVAVLSFFMFFISLGTTFAQSYLSNFEAATVVRQEIMSIQNNASGQFTNTAEVAPEMFANTNPQLYANWTLLLNFQSYLELFGDNADVRDGALAVYERTISSNNIVAASFFSNANDYLQGLITN
jgi:hypothetical protein